MLITDQKIKIKKMVTEISQYNTNVVEKIFKENK